MKNLTLTILVTFLFSTNIFSQTIDNLSIKTLGSEFMIVTKQYSFRMPLGIVVIDFGNGMYATNNKRDKEDEAVLRALNGTALPSFSAAQAINIIISSGYDLIDTSITPFGESGLMYTYLLAKKI